MLISEISCRRLEIGLETGSGMLGCDGGSGGGVASEEASEEEVKGECVCVCVCVCVRVFGVEGERTTDGAVLCCLRCGFASGVVPGC